MNISANTKFIIDCLIDRHRWPEWEFDGEAVRIFQHWQTTGQISAAERERIAPMIWGQKMKEMTLEMLMAECREYRREGFGWLVPILHTLSFETPSRNHGVMWKAIIRMTRSLATEFGYDPIALCRENGLVIT